MKKLALALVAILAAASIADTSDAQSRGGSRGGGTGADRGGSPGGGGMGGGRGGFPGGGQGSGWHGGGHGSGWHGGGYGRGWHGGGWRGGHWGGGWYGGWYGPSVGLYFGGWPWYGVPYYDYGYGYPYGYGSYPVYAQPDPGVYIEQPQGSAPANAPASAPAPRNMPAVSWFYCTDPAGYYPYVQSCSKAWMRVVPDPAQPPPGPRQQ